MGEIADYIFDQFVCHPEDGPPSPEDYLDMTDNELRKETSMCRSEKLKSIRRWPHELSEKQRYCLAAWLAKRDSKA